MRVLVLALVMVWSGGLAWSQPVRPPPEVARALEKLKKGEKLTPEERAAVEEWGRAAGGGKGPHSGGGAGRWAGMAAGNNLAGKTLADFGMCPRVKVPLPAKTPDRTGYLAVARKAAAVFARADKKRAAAIDAQLTADGANGAKLGGALLAGGDAGAAIYATARAAALRPHDALLASNLGVLLTGKRELLDAHAVLAWADARSPDSAFITVNRAWLVYSAGDGAGARSLFERARKLDAALAAPRVGLGLLDGCAGKGDFAAEQLRDAVGKLPSKATTLGLALADPADPAPEWKGSVPFGLPDPPLSRELGSATADHARGQPILDAVMAEIRRFGPIGLGPMVEQARRIDGNAGMDVARYQSLHEPYQTRVAKLASDTAKEVAPLLQRWMKEGPMGRVQERLAAAAGCSDDACRKQLEYQFCLEDKATLARLHPLVWKAIGEGWQEARPAFVDNWETATGMLEKMQSPAWSAAHAQALRLELATGYMVYIHAAVSWNFLASQVEKTVCVPPPPPPPKASPYTVPEPKESNFCDRLDFEVRVAAWSVKVDCSSTTLAWKLPGSTFSFTNDPLSNETRIHFGMEAREGVLNVGSSAYVELSNGVVNRVGGTFETSAGWGDLKAGIAGEGGFAALEGGPPYDFKPFGDVWAVKPNLPGDFLE